jgi:integrase
MARGFARKRGDTWYAYWRDPSGRQRSKAIGTRKKDAEAYLGTVQGRLTDGTYCELHEATFKEFAALWITDYATVQVKPSTLCGYQCMIDHSLVPHFGPTKLTAIRTADVQTYVADLNRKKLQPATVQKHLTLLKGMLKQAVEWDYLRTNPALTVKPPRRTHNEMDFLTPAELHQLLGALDPYWQPLFLTAALTGMRLGELLALQWSDLDWNSGTIRVRRSVWQGEFQDPKSARSVRTIGMSPRLAAALFGHQVNTPWSEHNLVFPTEDGMLVDPSNLRHRIFEPALTAAGLRKIRIHDLRHTFASLLINQGENLKYVQQQLGHASITTTVDRYGHLMPDAHVGVSQRLDATVFGNGPENPDDKMLPSPQKQEQAPSSLSSGPAVSLVAGAGFEPTTFGL